MPETKNQTDKIKIAVLVSGGGTNLQALIDAQQSGILQSARITLVLSNTKDAYALKRAEHHNIRHVTITREMTGSNRNIEKEMIRLLDEEGIELIILAGFMMILSREFTSRYENRIINVHPSLIPSFCGKGFYGLKVHEAVLNSDVKITGATVHFVNEIPDGGKIILQKAVEVRENDTPKLLQKRVMEEAEHIILPLAAEKISKELLKRREE